MSAIKNWAMENMGEDEFDNYLEDLNERSL